MFAGDALVGVRACVRSGRAARWHMQENGFWCGELCPLKLNKSSVTFDDSDSLFFCCCCVYRYNVECEA